MLLRKYYFGRILPTERHWHGYRCRRHSGLLVLYWHYQGSDRRKLARRRHGYRYWWMMEQHLRLHPKLSKSLLVVGRDFLFLLLFLVKRSLSLYSHYSRIVSASLAWAAFFLASHITFIKEYFALLSVF